MPAGEYRPPMSIFRLLVCGTATVALGVGAYGMAHAAPHAAAHARSQTTDGEVSTTHAQEHERARALPRLRGTVDGDRNITINKGTVTSGRYRLIVDDQTSRHNWHMSKGSFSRKSTVSGTGIKRWRVTLNSGTYRIVCDVHPRTMRTSLTVS